MMGFITDTNCLNIAVAVRVAATLTVAVVAAVDKISADGTGISLSKIGTSQYRISGGVGGLTGLGLGLGAAFLGSCSDGVVPATPGGGRRSLGGTTMGLYEGKSARGTSSTGRGKLRGSGSRITGSTGGAPKSISRQRDHAR